MPVTDFNLYFLFLLHFSLSFSLQAFRRFWYRSHCQPSRSISFLRVLRAAGGHSMEQNQLRANGNGCDGADDLTGLHNRYEEAVERLNSLQSNAATLSKSIARGRTQSTNVEDMRKRLKRIGLSVSAFLSNFHCTSINLKQANWATNKQHWETVVTTLCVRNYYFMISTAICFRRLGLSFLLTI